MGEQVFGTFTLGLDNTSWVIVVEIWLYNILCHEQVFGVVAGDRKNLVNQYLDQKTIW